MTGRRLRGGAMLEIAVMATLGIAVPATLVIAVPARGAAGTERPSVMFSPAEVVAIQKALQPAGHAAASAAVPAPAQPFADSPPPTQLLANIFVSAVVDYGNGDWTVWANDFRITPHHQPDEFRVIAVKEDQVTIALTHGIEAPVHLRPHQTWRVATNDVVEGIFP